MLGRPPRSTLFPSTPLFRSLLLSGLVALRRRQEARARTLLGQALTAGADTAETLAGLGALEAGAGRWVWAAAETRAAVAAARGTLRHPYPREWLAEALTSFALNGPAATADSLLAAAVAGRGGWYRIHELRALAALRVGRCDVAAEQFLLLGDFGITPEDAPVWVERCRRGETR